MRKAVLGALVATAVALGVMATPVAAHEGRDGERGRSERVESRRGDRGDREWRHGKDRRGHHHRGDWDRGTRGGQALGAEDEAFLVLATQIGMSEILQGQLALDRSENPLVREYARVMVLDHLYQLAAQLDLLEKYGIELPELTDEQIAALRTLLATPVEQFDAGYATAQVVAHEQALAVFTAQAEDGENWKVTKFARRHVPVLERHLNLAEAVQAALGIRIDPAI
jgi:putative membrane protein